MARSMNKRLEELEHKRGGVEDTAIREAVRRMSTPDLLLFEQWCERSSEEAVEPNEEEAGAIERFEELLEEVRHEEGGR